MHLSLHNIRQIRAKHKEFAPGGSQWINLVFTDEHDKEFEVTAFVDKPIAIEGAGLIELMAIAVDNAAQGGSLVPLLEASIEAVKARKAALHE